MKVDLQVHSKYSRDSLASLQEIHHAARRSGVDGIALTDHNVFAGVSAMQAYLKSVGDEEFVLVQAEEVDTEFGEVLALFIQEKVNPSDFLSVADSVHAQGGLVSIAHPFDVRRRGAINPFNLSKKELSQVDCIEVFNSRSAHESNVRARRFASKNSKGFTAGSDAHWAFEVGRGFLECKESNEEELRALLKKGHCRVGGQQTPLPVLAATKAVKIAKKWFL